MTTRLDFWSTIKAIFARPEPGPSLDERIATRVAGIESIAIEHARAIGKGLSVRLAVLEGRSENVDAFYVKTVTQALSERQDTIARGLEMRIDVNTASTNGRLTELENELSQNMLKSAALEAKLAALVSKLRAGLE